MSQNPGFHYCIAHQGNGSHYDKENCELCAAEKEIDRLTSRVAELEERRQIIDDEAFEYGRRVAREEGIFGGISTGANVCAALRVAERLERGVVVGRMLRASRRSDQSCYDDGARK